MVSIIGWNLLSSINELPFQLLSLVEHTLVEQVMPEVVLTLQSRDQHVSILDELLDELIRSFQLDFMTLESVPEVRTVQERVAELQRWKPHVSVKVSSWTSLHFSSVRNGPGPFPNSKH